MKGSDFHPVFPKNAGTWLESEKERLSTISFERVSSPWHPADDSVLTAIIASSERKTPLSAIYHSLGRRDPIRRTICPHTIVEADGRLHVRAFDFERRRFSDFLVTRISDPKDDGGVAWVDKAADNDWHEHVTVQVAPSPLLPSEQARAAMKDLGLPVSGGGVRTRRALAFYLIRTLRLANLDVPDPGRRYVCTNRDEASKLFRSDQEIDKSGGRSTA